MDRRTRILNPCWDFTCVRSHTSYKLVQGIESTEGDITESIFRELGAISIVGALHTVIRESTRNDWNAGQGPR